MKIFSLLVSVGCLVTIAGCTQGGGQATETPLPTPTTASAVVSASTAEATAEAATAEEVVDRLRSAGLCDDPGDFDLQSMGSEYVAACGSPAPFLIAGEPWEGRLSADWCKSESGLSGKTMFIVQGTTWTVIHPMPNKRELEAIADAIGGTPVSLSQAC